MILVSLDHLPRYESLNPGFGAAAAFLRKHNVSELALGRHEIDGDRVFAVIEEGPMRGRAESRLEAHHRYIDVRVIITGTDEVGWAPIEHCREEAVAYNPDTDLVFYAERPLTWIALPAGSIAIYFPEDAHAPLAGQGHVRRMVIKVKCV